MMKYTVYQINLSDKDYENGVLREMYLDTIMDPTVEAIEKASGLYAKVAEIDALSFDHVFEIGNIGPEEKITRINDMHSVSVGDIIKSENGVAKFVAPYGFETVTIYLEVVMIKIMKIASEINGLSDRELKLLAEWIKDNAANSLANYLSFELQERDSINIEVQEPVC